jgi:hypothetical protein
MESRRDFLTHSAGLVAGLSMVPGFRLPSQGVCPNVVRLAVRNEIPRLCFELHVFRISYLPALLSRPIPDVSTVEDRTPGGHGDWETELDGWQRATGDLIQALLRSNSRVPDPTAVEAFTNFHTTHARCYRNLLKPPVDPCYELTMDWPPIRWRTKLLVHWLGDDTAQSILSAVCGQQVDPQDPRAELYRKLLRDEFLTSEFMYAVASVALALANNHFMKIRRLLEKLEIGCHWAKVMPELLSAVLYHKVVTLRELVRVA